MSADSDEIFTFILCVFAFFGVLPMRYRTLNKNWQYNRVYGRGKSYVHPHVVLYVAKNRVGYTRIGLTATKKVGHAIQRNRARRVMRAALSEHLSQNIGGYDIILVARGQTPHLKSTQLSKTLGKLFAKAGLPDLARPVQDAAGKTEAVPGNTP